jgi:hypothetical protein
MAHAPFEQAENSDSLALQGTHKRHQILLLLIRQLRAQHQVKPKFRIV